MVICLGATPGKAANDAINKGIVESEKASIVMIPAYCWPPESYWNRLLSEDEARDLHSISKWPVNLIEKRLDISLKEK